MVSINCAVPRMNIRRFFVWRFVRRTAPFSSPLRFAPVSSSYVQRLVYWSRLYRAGLVSSQSHCLRFFRRRAHSSTIVLRMISYYCTAAGRPGDLMVASNARAKKGGPGVQNPMSIGRLSLFAKTKIKGTDRREYLAAWVGAIRCESTREESAEVFSR